MFRTTHLRIGASSIDGVNTSMWQWFDGDPLVYTNWSPGQPNNGGRACAWISATTPNPWKDRSCTQQISSLCEFIDGKKFKID